MSTVLCSKCVPYGNFEIKTIGYIHTGCDECGSMDESRRLYTGDPRTAPKQLKDTYNVRFVPFRAFDHTRQICVTVVIEQFLDVVWAKEVRQTLPIEDPVALILALRDAANELEKLV